MNKWVDIGFSSRWRWGRERNGGRQPLTDLVDAPEHHWQSGPEVCPNHLFTSGSPRGSCERVGSGGVREVAEGPREGHSHGHLWGAKQLFMKYSRSPEVWAKPVGSPGPKACWRRGGGSQNNPCQDPTCSVAGWEQPVLRVTSGRVVPEVMFMIRNSLPGAMCFLPGRFRSRRSLSSLRTGLCPWCPPPAHHTRHSGIRGRKGCPEEDLGLTNPCIETGVLKPLKCNPSNYSSNPPDRFP